LFLFIFFLFSVFSRNSPFAANRRLTEEDVRRVHRSTLLIDTHNDVTSRTVSGFDIGKKAADGHTDLPRLREGGVGGVFFAVYVEASYASFVM
jgi:membrane dipeptidase